jgi:hypothetical protein
MKPLITSVSPSGHRISTPQPDPGFFRATKVGRCSDVPKITGYDRFSALEVDPAKYSALYEDRTSDRFIPTP